MKPYILTLVKESGTYYRNDSIAIKIKIVDSIKGIVTEPSEVDVTIIDPCGESIVTDESMVTDSDGYWCYDYDILSDAQYGVYNISITTQGEHQINNFLFVVFPWDVCSRTRTILSAYQQNDISDYKLAILAWHSYQIVLDDVYEFNHNEKPLCNPDTSEYFNGTNKTFQLKNYPIADYNGDEIVTGYGELDCGEDVTFFYIDENGDRIDGNVTVIDADNGIVELSDLSDNAVPNTIQKACVNYHTESQYYIKDIMREAVAYLTAYKVAMTYKSLGKATLADVQTNRQLDAEKFKDRYLELVELIGFSAIGCGK